MKSQRTNEDDVDVLRVVTWNVQGLRGDHDLLVGAIKALRPDILCLQEVPRRESGLAELSQVAAETDLTVAIGDKDTAGLAILIGGSIDPANVTPAPVVTIRKPRRWGVLPQYPRAIVSVHLPFDNDIVFVSNIHLALDAEQRREHVDRVLDLVDTVRVPAIVAGDLNEPPTGPVWAQLGSMFDDTGRGVAHGLTFPAEDPNVRIDAVHISPDLETLDFLVVKGLDGTPLAEAADHLPVVADVARRRRTRGSAAAVIAEATTVVQAADVGPEPITFRRRQTFSRLQPRED